MSEDHICQAQRQSDQMRCPACKLTWDVNDLEPPECPQEVHRRANEIMRKRAEEWAKKPKFW